MWRGELAVDLDYEWLDLDRIHLRSRFVRAACRAAELLTATGDVAAAIEPARAALDADPYHAGSYRALTAAYRGIGDATSARAITERGIELGAL
jgi:DNA-binding SARP family transcriptional activator